LRELGVLVRFRMLALRNVLRSLGRESLLKAVVIAVVGFFLWTGLFGGFLLSIKSAGKALPDPVDLADLTGLLLGLFFMSLLFLLTFSNAVISFGSLYKSPETAYLWGAPLDAGTIYAYKMLESLAFASWASAILGLPLLLAYGIAMHVSWTYYPAIPAVLAPFTVIPAAAGSTIAMLLTLLFPRGRAKALAVAFGAVAVFLAVAALKAWMVRRGAIPFSTVWSQKVLGQFRFARSPFLPSHWASSSLIAAARGEVSEALYNLGLLASTAAFLVALGQFLAVRLYARSWDAAASSVSRRRYPKRGLSDAVAAALASRLGSAPLFVQKDVRTFLRDPAQWSQAVIFFGLLGVYMANIRNLDYDLDNPVYPNLIATLNLLAVSLTLATMTTRFVFPLMSLEGRSFWVLGLMPVRRRNILLSKFVFAALGSVAVTEALVILSNQVLRMERSVTLVQVVLGALMALGLSAIAVGMGAVFPDFKSRTPSEIVSGFGGTLTLVVSLAFVLAIVVPEAIIRHRHLVRGVIGEQQFVAFAARVCVVALIVSALSVAGSLAWGIRALSRQEF
jgi:ABC-2 type transport system permease protein